MHFPSDRVLLRLLLLVPLLANCPWALAPPELFANATSSTTTIGGKPASPAQNRVEPVAIATFRLAPIHFHTTYHGVTLSIAPSRRRLIVTATITNHGGRVVFVQHGAMRKWTFGVLDVRGRSLVKQRHLPAHTEGFDSPLPPGRSKVQKFSLERLPGLAAPGTFYVYSTAPILAKPVGNGRLKTVYFRSPILRLILAVGKPPAWKVVAAMPRPQRRPRRRRVPAVVPPYPRFKIPGTGPIATLSGIAKAVGSQDLDAVRKLCYKGHHAVLPFYVAFAAQAIAEDQCIASGKKKFSVNPWPRLQPSPQVFSNILSRLNPRSLKVNGNTASVGIFWFHRGKFIAFPSFGYHFRKVNGRWLLDSWATQESARGPSLRSYRLNVENSLRQAETFESLAKDLAAGRFVSLSDLRAAARHRFGAVSDWFMLQSMKHNKQWMRANVWLAKRIEKEEKAAKNQAPETQP